MQHFISQEFLRISLPPHLTTISDYAFSQCQALKYVEIPPDSNLSTIKYGAFAGTKIERFIIPPLLTILEHEVFSSCYDLKEIDIPENSQLSETVMSAFSYTNKVNFVIPKNVTKISRIDYEHCETLDENSELDQIEVEAIISQIIMIPLTLKDKIVTREQYYY